MSINRRRLKWCLFCCLTLAVTLSCKTIHEIQIILPSATPDLGGEVEKTPVPLDNEESPGNPGMWQQVTVTPGVGANQHFQPLGQIGGNSYAIDLSGHYAYLGSGPRLLVIDLDSSNEPQLVGRSEALPGVIRGVAVREPYAYVAAGRGNLRVLDVSTPTAPHEVGALEEFQWAMAVVLDGDLLYIADNAQGLWIADISNPTKPTLLGTYKLGQPAASLAVRTGVVYVVHMSGGLAVIDASNPASPKLAAEMELPQMSSSIALSGNYALIAAGFAGLWVVDIKDPAHPEKVANFKTTWADGIAVQGDLAFMTDWSTGLMIFDLTDPTTPKQLGTMPITIFSQQVPGQRQVVARDGRVFLANPNQGLVVIDASQPRKPTQVASFDADLSGAAFDTDVIGSMVYVTRDFIGLGSVDRMNPQELAFRLSELSFVHGAPVRTSWKFAIQRKHAFLTDVNLGFRVVDLSTFEQVAAIKEPRSWSNLVLDDNYAYASTTDHDPKEGDLEAKRSLRVVDISDPLHPVQIGLLKMENNTQALAIQGQVLLYADFLELKQRSEGESSALRLIDISNPANPTQISQVDTTGHCSNVSSIVVQGDYAILGDREAGLCVVDISDKTDPRLVSTWDEVLTVFDMALVGERIYAACYGTVMAFDISQPLQPKIEDFTVTPGLAWGIAAQPNPSQGVLVYIADMDGGLNLLSYR